MTNASELLPCPFCGVRPSNACFSYESGSKDVWGVTCEDCGISIEGDRCKADIAEQSAITAWNTRQVTQLEAQLAEVREALGKVQSYHKGEKPYDFHRLPDDQRQNEAFDAWQVIACEIDALLTKEPK